MAEGHFGGNASLIRRAFLSAVFWEIRLKALCLKALRLKEEGCKICSAVGLRGVFVWREKAVNT